MKLSTWTIYQGKNLQDIEGKIFVAHEFPFVLIRPDTNNPGKVLGLAIVGDYVTTQVMDLLNREYSNDNIYEIFQDKIGLIDMANINEYIIKDENLSLKPIRSKNINALIDVYNIFLKKEAIEFESENYATLELLKEQPEIFMELDLNTMPLPQLINALSAGLQDYNQRMNEIHNNSALSEEEKIQKTLQISTLQQNLILFFDATVKNLEGIIVKQNEEIDALKKEVNDLKK